jgi:hypothetical protein
MHDHLSSLRRRGLLFLCSLLLGGVLVWLWDALDPAPVPSVPSGLTTAVRPPPPAESTLEPESPPAAAMPTPSVGRARLLNAPDSDGERDVTVLRELTGAMLSALPEAGRPPLGNNEEFARALRGSNQTRSVFIPDDHPAFDGKGQIVDRWGTPYHFHPRSPAWVEIRSAGPDCTLFTNDDFVDPWSRKLMRLKQEENRN